jgi:DNA polymerase II small subunit/DNA polymerase delta subunit B
MEHIKFYSKLKQMLSRAQADLIKDIDIEKILELQSKAGEVVESFEKTAQQIEDDSEKHHQSIKATVEGSMVIDLPQFVGTFAKMACFINPRKSVCMIDGRLAMNETLWNDLCPDDALEMAFRWVSFFVMPSEEGAKTTSEPQPESASPPMEA